LKMLSKCVTFACWSQATSIISAFMHSYPSLV
jgi:hypothetical protein